jgi:putative inorganic carbon (HCO3(-)) transporter
LADHPRSITRLLQGSVLFLLFHYFFFYIGSFEYLGNNVEFWLFPAVLTGIALFLLVSGLSAPTPLARPLIALVVAVVLGTVFSADPRRSLGTLYILGQAILLYTLVSELVARGWPAQLVLSAYLIAGALNIATQLVAPIQWYVQWLGASGGQIFPSIPYRHPGQNYLAFYVTPLLMVALTQLAGKRGKTTRILLIVYVVVLTALLYLSSSRGGWLGAGFALVVLAFLLARHYPERWQTFWHALRTRAVLWLPVVAGVFLLLFAAVYVLRVAALSPSHGSVLTSRSPMWPAAWQTFLRHPLLGQGPNTYYISYLQNSSVPPDGLFYHAHSLPLNILAETGLLGAAAFLWLVVAAVRALWRKFQSADQARLPVVLAGFAVLAVVLGHGIVDVFYVWSLPLWATVIPLAVAVAQPAEAGRKRVRPWWLLAIVALGWATVWVLQPYNQGVRLADDGQLEQARPYLVEALRRDPASPVPHQQLALLDSFLVEAAPDSAEAPALRQEALQEMGRATQLDPTWSLNWANLAALEADQGDPNAALEAIGKARQEAPRASIYALEMGAIDEGMGRTDDARQAYLDALNLEPGLAPASFWRSSPLRQEVSKTWQSSVPATPAPDLAMALEEVRDNPGSTSSYVSVAEAYLALGDLDQAEHYARLGLQAFISPGAEPVDVDWTLAKILAAHEDFGGAAKLGSRIVDALDPEGAGAGLSYDNSGTNWFALGHTSQNQPVVPQFVSVPLNDEWGRRLLSVADWYERAGQPEQAQELRAKLAAWIPDVATLSPAQ